MMFSLQSLYVHRSAAVLHAPGDDGEIDVLRARRNICITAVVARRDTSRGSVL
jgi:hypothetical protein